MACIKRLLVTGGAGFIGSNFVITLSEQQPDWRFVVVDCLHPCGTAANLLVDGRLPSNVVFVNAKIQDRPTIAGLLREHEVCTVVHFAAQSHVDTSFTDSLTYTQDNVLGTHCLLEEARLYGRLERFVHISTDEVYGESELHQKTEQSLLCPTNPYAASKAGAEMLVRAYHMSYKLPVVITRGNNVYGPKQYPEKVIPKFITQLRRGERCTLHGSGQALRSFIYVSDTVDAIKHVVLAGEIGEVYNIASDDELYVVDVARSLVKELIGSQAALDDHVTFVDDRLFNDRRYFISDAKLRALGWQQRVPWTEGLQRTIEWYKANPSHWDKQ